MSVADSASAVSHLVPAEVCRDFARSSRLEWLETNHTGAFAMGTVAGVNTRRYHGLLIAALHPPADRFSILPRVEETVFYGNGSFEIATVQYPGAVQPHGHDFLESFQLNPFPTWSYDVNGFTVEKSVCLVDKRQEVLVSYRASKPCKLGVRILLSLRDYHALSSAHEGIASAADVAAGRCRFKPYAHLPPVTFYHSAYTFQAEPQWFLREEYLRELERGLDFREDLFSPGVLFFQLQPADRAWFVASLETDGEEMDEERVETLVARETQRRTFGKPLARALDQFRITREGGKPSLLAGYPWFTDWGRDILISLPALTRAGYAAEESKEILTMLLEARSNGVLPNRFMDQGGTPEFNTVDATLWLFVAAYDLLHSESDMTFLRETVYPAALDILDWHRRGTYFNIKVDETDHLLAAGADGVQLTWMDAKIGGYVVTPRTGKPVEINALWYNALKITEIWAQTLGDTSEAEKLGAEAGRVRESFQRVFWNAAANCLYDVVNDASIRPNQLFALSLPFPLFEGSEARAIVDTVRDKLLTPVGLRTLSPDDTAYRPRFEGDMRSRDSAYHQGTVWPWLIGPYVGAYLTAYGHNAESAEHCRQALSGVESQMDACCLGSISEVYDGGEPRHAGGCPAQLWSVAQAIIARWMLDS